MLGLDATDDGLRVYSRHGFVEVCGIDRWKGESVGGDVDESGCFYFGGGEVEVLKGVNWFLVESFYKDMTRVDIIKLFQIIISE